MPDNRAHFRGNVFIHRQLLKRAVALAAARKPSLRGQKPTVIGKIEVNALDRKCQLSIALVLRSPLEEGYPVAGKDLAP